MGTCLTMGSIFILRWCEPRRDRAQAMCSLRDRQQIGTDHLSLLCSFEVLWTIFSLHSSQVPYIYIYIINSYNQPTSPQGEMRPDPAPLRELKLSRGPSSLHKSVMSVDFPQPFLAMIWQQLASTTASNTWIKPGINHISGLPPQESCFWWFLTVFVTPQIHKNHGVQWF